MSTRVVYHCDWESCTSWVETNEGFPIAGWLKVFEQDTNTQYHYCCWNCLMLDAATVSPPVEL